MTCEGCGRHVEEVGMLHRTNPKGELPFKGKCNQCMGGTATTTNETALGAALFGVTEKEEPQ